MYYVCHSEQSEDSIPQILEGILAFVRRNMKVKTIIMEDGTRADKPEYPIKAVREIILNALIHRDYSVHTDRSPVRLVMYEDRLELENPGGLYDRITVDDLGKASANSKDVDMEQEILNYCITPRSREELAERFGSEVFYRVRVSVKLIFRVIAGVILDLLEAYVLNNI